MVTMRENRGYKFDMYPKLGGVLIPEFDRAHWQQLKGKNDANNKEANSFSSEAPMLGP
jgi:hypothetical protein